MEVEKWKTIEGCKDYQVSNMGRVKSLKFGKELRLKSNKCRNGSLQVQRYNEGIKKYMLIHRLVCEAFVQNDSLFNNEINHLDENKENNCASNLEWSDRKHNCNYGTRTERMVKTQTNDPKRSKKVKCLETGIVYLSLADVQRNFGFNKGNISKCCRDKIKSVYGYHWRYVY